MRKRRFFFGLGVFMCALLLQSFSWGVLAAAENEPTPTKEIQLVYGSTRFL